MKMSILVSNINQREQKDLSSEVRHKSICHSLPPHMRGTDRNQIFIFCLESVIPADAFVRVVDPGSEGIILLLAEVAESVIYVLKAKLT